MIGLYDKDSIPGYYRWDEDDPEPEEEGEYECDGPSRAEYLNAYEPEHETDVLKVEDEDGVVESFEEQQEDGCVLVSRLRTQHDEDDLLAADLGSAGYDEASRDVTESTRTRRA